MSPTAIAQSEVCSCCKERKDVSHFSPDKRKKNNLQSQCKTCFKKYNKTRDPLKRRISDIKSKYKLDQTTYEEMVKATPHCPICGSEEPLVVDHDHSTGEVRGLICQPCNKGLGFFRDNIESMKNAITYLQ